MANDSLNDLLKGIESNERIENMDFETRSRSKGLQVLKPGTREMVASQVDISDSAPAKNAGILTRMKANALKNKKELEAAEVIFDTQLEKLKHQATAAKRESQAFWDAKSVEVSESIKTYVQSTLSSLENQRLTTKNEAIEQAYKETSRKITEIYADEQLPPMLRDRLIQELMENMKNTVDRLKNDAIAQRYDLT
ncbi:MAG TPA: hypothetical protein P5032_06160 [Candidatus Competibacter sp.]|nr:hypothetical protein [Candidatus Competibacteraceae bacterium]HRW65320.1 hypothetical protein [Candidatus Competibacter sp.]